MQPQADITVLERGIRPMAKLGITGGGRCNLTNSFRDIADLRTAYPRGAQLMKRLFRQFGPEETCQWWEREGVALTTQEDQCVFPRSQDAMQVVNTLLHAMQQTGVRLITSAKVSAIRPRGEDYDVVYNERTDSFGRVVVATGGSPRAAGLGFLPQMQVVQPVPSLFALNIDDRPLQALTGTVVPEAVVGIAGTKFKAQGDLLICHFGLSGPATLRLTSYAARHLAEHDYQVTLCINWMQGRNEEETRATLQGYADSRKLVGNIYPQHLTARHWQTLLTRAGIAASRRWDALTTKEMNRLTATLTSDTYPTQGRRTEKGEFVTCGGIALSEIDANTLECKNFPGLYLAGEVLDVDAITGGFNLQAAWSTGYAVAKSIAEGTFF